MTKRLMILAVVLAAALLAAGCGSSAGGGSDDALSVLPKESPVVATVETDPEGDQYKKLNDLLGKFPFAGQVRQQLKQSINSSSQGIDFDKDVKPVLGNDLIIAVPSAAALKEDDTPVLLAIKAKDEGKAEDLVDKSGEKVASAGDADIHKASDDTFVAIKDGVIIAGDKQEDVAAALERDDGLTEDDLDDRFAGLEADGIVNVGVDMEQVIANDPEAAEAKKVKFVAGMRDLGLVFRVVDDGIEQEFKLTTEGVSEQDLPLATGSEPAPVVRRASDVGFGMRGLTQLINWGVATSRLTDPSEYREFQGRKTRLNKELGIDIDKDVIAQFQGDSSMSFALDGSFALRSQLEDPAAFRATLKKATPKLKEAFDKENVQAVTPEKPDGFYALAAPDGRKFAFAVIDDQFVLATDAARASQFAGQSATAVPGTNGSFVVALDARTIANELAKQQGQAGAGLFTGALGDFVGSVETETDGTSGKFKLTIK
jgi:hypothetical protein